MSQLTTHVITVDSANRNGNAYPNAGIYQIQLPQRYRNVCSAQLLNIELPELSPPQKIVFLSIDKLSMIDSTSPSGGVQFALAKIPLSFPFSNTYYVDSLTSSFMEIPLQNPIATMDKFNVSFKDSNGNVLTMPNNHTFQIQLKCGDYVTNGGGSTILGTHRVLGGTR
ncbi:hypothetical protein ATCVGM07011_269L [Acanthocystis turfacea Chlorella virus GM0701.1]|nr:hypothetical protein ATCVGM07011_269L [Acanthocystis turfacea Chlorella virus GM0701.1]